MYAHKHPVPVAPISNVCDQYDVPFKRLEFVSSSKQKTYRVVEVLLVGLKCESIGILSQISSRVHLELSSKLNAFYIDFLMRFRKSASMHL